MKLRKKIAVSTLAVGLALGSLSGLPLSGQGMSDKLGIHAAVAAEAGNYAKLHEALRQDEQAAQLVAGVRANIGAMEEDLSIVSDIMDKIHNHENYMGDPSKYPNLTGSNVYRLFAALVYETDPARIQALFADPTHSQVLKEMAALTDVSGLTAADLDLFFNEVKNVLLKRLEDKTPAELVDLVFSGGSKDITPLRQLVNEAMKDVINNSDDHVSKVLRSIGILPVDLVNVWSRFASETDPGNSASKAIAAALVRSESEFSVTTGDMGRKATPVLKVLGHAVPNVLVKWTSSNPDITFQDGTFNLRSSVINATAAIEARDILYNQLLYKGQLTMSYSGGYIGGGGGGGSTEPAPGSEVKPPENTAETVSGAENAINAAKERLANASPEERESILNALKAEMEKAIAAIATLDVSGLITVDGGVASATIDLGAIEKQLKEIAEQAAKLNNMLRELDPGITPAVVKLTLDFGPFQADTTEITLLKQVMEAIVNNGMNRVSVQVNGAEVVVRADAYQSETKFVISRKDPSEAADLTDKKLASGVYGFEIYRDGTLLTQFDSSVELRIPVTDLSGIDPDLLSLVKIADGKLVIYGGQYDPETNKHVASRNSFSTYTVIENRIEFTDIGSVMSWAGRPIQVVAAKGIIDGRAPGLFVPNEKVTRAEFAKLIVMTFGLEDSSATHNFSDVASNDWFAPYVAAAAKHGIVKGRTATEFDPHGSITRAEMATMAARALVAAGKSGYASNPEQWLQTFADADTIHSTLREGVALAVKLGIVVGEENNRFNPNNDSTRAQAAVVIYRLLNN